MITILIFSHVMIKIDYPFGRNISYFIFFCIIFDFSSKLFLFLSSDKNIEIINLIYKNRDEIRLTLLDDSLNIYKTL